MIPVRSAVKHNPVSTPICGVGTEGFKCAIVSWAAPLLAFVVLALGLRYPVLSAFNILIVAFGITATIRSLAHIHRFGNCGLGAHVTVGVVLNVAVIALAVIYLFLGLDPLGLQP